jgi:hypothetical protein
MSAGGSPRKSACTGVLGKGSIHETHIGAARTIFFSGLARVDQGSGEIVAWCVSEKGAPRRWSRGERSYPRQNDLYVGAELT